MQHQEMQLRLEMDHKDPRVARVRLRLTNTTSSNFLKVITVANGLNLQVHNLWYKSQTKKDGTVFRIIFKDETSLNSPKIQRLMDFIRSLQDY